MGHASRCIPIIRELQIAGFEPIIASDGDALKLLKKEFPKLTSYQLPSYNINYSKNRNTLKLKLFFSVPAIFSAVKKEKKITSKIVEKEQISGIISDNRFGVYHPKIPSVYITHQLNVLAGFATFFTSKIHRRIMMKYSEVWIPDTQHKHNFSGKLSAFNDSNLNLKYIGVLSRLKSFKLEVKYDVTVLLSGPEPQRTILEKKLLNQLNNFQGKILFIRGKVTSEKLQQPKNWEVRNLVLTNELEKLLNQSKLIIARSGYSTIMDLAVLGKKAFFIPTSGQNEQIYLAKRMQKLNIAPHSSQEKFKLEQLNKVKNYCGFSETQSKFDLNFFSLF